MRTDETLLLQALKAKELNTRGFSGYDLVQHAIDSDSSVKEKLRNICAFISPEMFAEVEGVCSMLSLSKRQVVEMALSDFLHKAETIIKDTGAYDSLEK